MLYREHCSPRNIKLILAYDGTDFSGWQRQGAFRGHEDRQSNSAGGDQARTVQAVVEKALEKIHKEKISLTGSGRTDAGVHAAGQAANFFSLIKNMEAARFVPALNSLLPRDVRVISAAETRSDFHARFDARLRTYRYFFITRQNALPWELRYAWHIRRQPDLKRLNDYARLFCGEMDCTAFAIPSDKSVSRNRYISGASFFVEGDKLVFEISANAFLWKMVRSIAGTLLRFEEKGFDPLYLKEVIEKGQRSLSGPIAPPQGLFLWTINYYRD